VAHIHLVSDLPGATALGESLRRAGLSPTSAREADALLVLIDRPLDAPEQDLLDRTRRSLPVLLAGPTLRNVAPATPLADATGLLPGWTTPRHEVRVLPGPQGQEVAARLDDGLALTDRFVVPDKVADDVDQLLVARYAQLTYPVCTWRAGTGLGVFTLGSTDVTLADPRYHRLVGRWLRHALGMRDGPQIRVGLLGRGPAAAAHALAVERTDGLCLATVSDPQLAAPPAGPGAPASLAGGKQLAVREAAALVTSDDVSLVVIASDVDTRAEWAGRALAAGKHVVVEQPLSLSIAAADDLIADAGSRDLTLAVHHSCRLDPDYRALKAAVRGGAIGDLFHLEVFHGGFGRPGDLVAAGGHGPFATGAGRPGGDGDTAAPGAAPGGEWAGAGLGMAAVSSGGAIDYLDWILDLIDEDVELVWSTAQKRVWHEVTDADHTRVLVRFAYGAEAELVFSTVAALPKPTFYALGTRGAISGRRRGGAPAALRLVGADGSRTKLALPGPPGAPLHRALADWLLSSWPMPGSPDDSRRGVSVMAAANRSAAEGGRPVPPA
jgi:predicted dehydrogenase